MAYSQYKKHMTVAQQAIALLEAKVASRNQAPELEERIRRLHQLLLEERDPALLPKRFVTVISGYSPVQLFVVWSLSIKQSPHANAPQEQWCLGLRVQQHIKESKVGILEVVQGIFGVNGWIEFGTTPESTSLPEILDWLWESPWFSLEPYQEKQTPEHLLGRQIDLWLSLIQPIPILVDTAQ